MTRITGLMAGLLTFVIGTSAIAQVDCTGGCTDTKYGLGTMPEYRKDEYPPNDFRWTEDAFGPDFPECEGGPTPGADCDTNADCGAGGSCKRGVSFFMNRGDLTGALGSCGPERQHGPIPGQVILRELTSCTPTSEGPTCTGGANAGRGCHLNMASTIAAIECPGGTCTDNGGGCRVEIPLETANGGVTPVATTSELKIFTSTYQSISPVNGDLYNLTAQTGNTFGGTGDASNPQCRALFASIRLKPSMATRYLLPASRGGDGTMTYLRWDSAYGLNNPSGCTEAAGTCDRTESATNFRFHTDDTRLCCDANTPALNTCSGFLGQASGNYPILTSRTCQTATRPWVNDENIVPDWIFRGGRATPFHGDEDFVNPGQLSGLCLNNRFVDCYAAGANAACAGNRNPFNCCTGAGAGYCSDSSACSAPGIGGSGGNARPADCCTGAGTGTCGDRCGALGDTCDFREFGPRVGTQCARDSALNPRPDCCAWAIYNFRGVPDRGCTLLPRMPYDGDPGPDCSVANYGIDHRWDDDCNGAADYPSDRCFFYSEWDQNRDTDGDCALGRCRGDECECGDADGDGQVAVQDLVRINLAIFNPLDGNIRSLLDDTNNDVAVNVSDIVGANLELFKPDSSVCRHITPRQCGASVPSPCCGDGGITPGENCDDGNLAVNDGCNGACRVEFGWTCDNDPPPSQCTPLP